MVLHFNVRPFPVRAKKERIITKLFFIVCVHIFISIKITILIQNDYSLIHFLKVLWKNNLFSILNVFFKFSLVTRNSRKPWPVQEFWILFVSCIVFTASHRCPVKWPVRWPRKNKSLVWFWSFWRIRNINHLVIVQQLPSDSTTSYS